MLLYLILEAKNNIAESLNKRGCNVTVLPCDTSAEEIIAMNPDGIMLSNGPGDPKECVYQIEQIKKLYNSDIPIFAICLGHQLMAPTSLPRYSARAFSLRDCRVSPST